MYKIGIEEYPFFDNSIETLNLRVNMEGDGFVLKEAKEFMKWGKNKEKMIVP